MIKEISLVNRKVNKQIYDSVREENIHILRVVQLQQLNMQVSEVGKLVKSFISMVNLDVNQLRKSLKNIDSLIAVMLQLLEDDLLKWVLSFEWVNTLRKLINSSINKLAIVKVSGCYIGWISMGLEIVNVKSNVNYLVDKDVIEYIRTVDNSMMDVVNVKTITKNYHVLIIKGSQFSSKVYIYSSETTEGSKKVFFSVFIRIVEL